MNEKDPTKFRIRIDNESPDTRFEEEIRDRRIEKLSRRITFVSILIPCLIAVILLVAYLDIRKRVGGMHSTGAAVSQDLDSRLSLVSEKQAKLEDMVIKKIEVELKEATTAIRYIRSARKADNKTLKGAIAGIEKRVGPARKDLENAASRINALDKNLTNLGKELDKNLTNLGKELDKAKNDLNKMQADISLLSSAKIDGKALDNALNSKQKIYEQKLKQIAEDLASKVESIRKRIKKIEMNMQSVAATPKPIPSKKPAEETAVPQPGTIIEEDILNKTGS